MVRLSSWIALLSLVSIAVAAPPADPVATIEIDHLLQFVAQSDCAFFRNGTWYEGKQASQHLREKYEYLAKREPIASAEVFVEKVATRSSLSSQPYKVRCAPEAELSTNRWLLDALARFRAKAGAH